MTTFIHIIFSMLYGICMAFLIYYVYNRFPEKWLQEFDALPSDPNYRKAKRLVFIPHILVLFVVSFLACGLTLYEWSLFPELGMDYTILLLLLYPILVLLFISDLKNRIIPHQILIALLIVSIFMTGQYTRQEAELSTNSFSFYLFLQNFGARLLAGICISVAVFLPFYIIGRIKKSECIGFGDIKLIFVCSLLCGAFGMLCALPLAFFSSALFMLISLAIGKLKKRHTSPFSDATKKPLHFADNPKYIALGPFISTSVFIYLLLARELFIVRFEILWNL